MTMMGCKFSEGAVFRRMRLRPLLLQQVAAMRACRPSKKSLLLEQKPSVTNSHLAQPQDRMISACPSSPSFRIFFEDAATHAHQQQIGKNEAHDAAPSKEKSVQKKVKRKMKRHIKSAMRKRREAVKKLTMEAHHYF
ncbi:uncharacterized protein LOC131020192 isoform X2 [Salvia miltiorrhiza]|uniref:uncharacterized protein LOC131020192 isoform X2 n=1 Tax=Salvia miltiorrhiza TaxID=226208 RepID=UPI0025AD7CD9|nr:uncharacterized protein LOC131020192 isoform X2 [Salvia miltiorrhiza]